jgi:hypothetical protein
VPFPLKQQEAKCVIDGSRQHQQKKKSPVPPGIKKITGEKHKAVLPFQRPGKYKPIQAKNEW